MKLYINKIDLFIWLVLIFVAAGGAKAETESSALRPRYGASVYGGVNMHSASFHKLPGVPNCCEQFDSGIGAAINFALHYTTPLRPKWSLFAKLGFINNSALLKADENTTVFSTVKNGSDAGKFEHRLDVKLGAITFEPTLMYNPYKSLFVGAGFSAGFLTNYKFDQREVILEPQGATFLDSLGRDSELATRNHYQGDIPEATKLLLSGVVTAYYDFPMNKRGTLLLSPEINFSYAFSPVIDGYVWRTNALRFGVGVKYSPAPPEPLNPKFKREERRDTVIIADESISAPIFTRGAERRTFDTLIGEDEILYSDITLATDTLRTPKQYFFDVDVAHHFVNDSGAVVYADYATVEEYITRSVKPLLSYIFFDDSSSALADRYVRVNSSEISKFSENRFHKTSTLQIYHNILNIIGSRMRALPKANLTLTAIDNGVETAADKSLLSRRTETIADYLTSVWGIDPSRIKKQTSRETFEPQGTPDDPLKLEETRRVEMSSNVWEALQPVFTNDTIAVMNLPEIDLLPIVRAQSGVAKWNASLKQSDRILGQYSGEGEPPKKLVWKFDDNSKNRITDGTVLTYALEATDNKGKTKASAEKNIPIKFSTLENKETDGLGNILIDKFSLVLFEFDRSEITPNNMRIVDYIKSRITTLSKVYITGYTDLLGPADHNLRLSQDRANSTAAALKAKTEEVLGIGATNELYDNALPEGRYYSRTVEILIKTPMQSPQ